MAARGYQPKLVLVATGNATNEQVLSALLGAADAIESALAELETGVVVVG